MKSKILAVILFTATCVALTSCDWLFGKKQDDVKPLSIKGKWNIENISDSSLTHKNDIGLLAFAMSAKDSLPLTAEFLNDSILIVSNDSMHYYLDSAIHTVFVKDDTATIALNIKSHTNSSMQLYAVSDSLFYQLKRK